MKVGLVVPQFGINATKENLIEFIQLAEKEGFESLWVYDRMLYPLDPQPPYPYSGPPDMSEWPEHFKNVLDPVTTLAFIAANTKNTNLGTCIIDMVFHNPITLAKEFTTIDIYPEVECFVVLVLDGPSMNSLHLISRMRKEEIE